uniref:Sulfate_transp domain-containing protein n=1 Tax=Echinostoma caproni TaxID=27848 RepID=A0A182ZZZ7_9TREM
LGNLTCYMAPAMVDGFVTGASVHVLTSQISSLFGVKAAAKKEGIGSLFLIAYSRRNYVDILSA